MDPPPTTSLAQAAINNTKWIKDKLRSQVLQVESIVQHCGNDAIDAHRQDILVLSTSALAILDILEVYQRAYLDSRKRSSILGDWLEEAFEQQLNERH